MRAWHFTEMPYPHIPPFDELKNTRVTIPNRLFDPKIGADLYNRYLDEHCIADELGLDIMLNEHHSSASCIDSCVPLPAAILARQTKNARILILGNPVANRGEPVRIAEEMAMIDCHLAWPARRRLRARRADRDQSRQLQSDHDQRAAVGGHRPRDAGLDHARRAVQLRRPVLAQARGQHLAAALPAAASAGLDHRLERPRERAQGRAARLHLRDLPAALREHAQPVRRLPQALCRRRRAAPGRHRVHAAGLHRRFRQRGGEGRAGAALVHPLQQDRAAVQEPARLCLDRAQRAGAAGQVRRPHRGGARAGPRLHDGARHPDRRHARQGGGAHPQVLRPGRRLRSPDDDAAGRPPRSQAHGPQHDPVRQGGVSADQGSAADGRVEGGAEPALAK